MLWDTLIFSCTILGVHRAQRNILRSNNALVNVLKAQGVGYAAITWLTSVPVSVGLDFRNKVLVTNIHHIYHNIHHIHHRPLFCWTWTVNTSSYVHKINLPMQSARECESCLQPVRYVKPIRIFILAILTLNPWQAILSGQYHQLHVLGTLRDGWISVIASCKMVVSLLKLKDGNSKGSVSTVYSHVSFFPNFVSTLLVKCLIQTAVHLKRT
jgi:hypothetical protein